MDISVPYRDREIVNGKLGQEERFNNRWQVGP